MPRADEDPGANPLLAALTARIARDGPIPVEAYMRACLGDPEHGYWQRGESIGAGGDFITAPEISQAFGELIGLWCAVTWQGMGRPSTVRLVELGPGRGTLMRDALRAARLVPDFLAAAGVHLVEASPPLRVLQQRTLAASPAAAPPAWHGSVAEVPPGPAIVVANEFLDALPIRQLVHQDGAWRERVVALDAQGGLAFAAGARAEIAAPELPPPRTGDILELRPQEAHLIAALAQRAEPVAALVIDYGPAGAGYGDTLQAVRGHAWVDPLTDPGRVDLTAHVHFAPLAATARTAGLAVDGPLSQAELLGRLGIAERAARLMAANPEAAPAIEAGVQRLLSPTGMGSLFKAIALRSPQLPPAPGFV